MGTRALGSYSFREMPAPGLAAHPTVPHPRRTLTALLCHAGPCRRRYSPHITEVRVVERRNVRRAKLYYLRDRTAKELRT